MIRNDQSIYDERASAWWDFRDPIFAPLYAMVPARLAYLERRGISFAGERTVDVGAGGGYVSEALARQGADVVNVDLAAGALVASKAHARATNVTGIAWARANAQALPLAQESCTRAVVTDVLVHVDDPAQVLREIGRVLAPGGTLWFCTVNATWLARFILVTLGEDVLRIVHRGTHDPARFLSPATLQAHLEAAGFHLVDTEGIGPTGVGRRGLTFGRFPSRAIFYQGLAIRDESP